MLFQEISNLFQRFFLSKYRTITAQTQPFFCEENLWGLKIMERRFTLSIAFAPGNILVSLTKTGAGTLGQQRGISAASMGTVLLPYQAVRVGLAGDFTDDGDPLAAKFLSFERVGYIEHDNIYKFSAPGASAPLTLAVGETASLDLVANTYGRTTVLTKIREARVTRSPQVASVFQKICWFGSSNTQVKVKFIEKGSSQIIGILIALLLP